MSHDLQEPITHLTLNNTFASVLERRLKRRDVLSGSLQMASATVLSSLGLVACSDDDPAPQAVSTVPVLGFTVVGKSLEDRVTVPAGYSARALYALGDPIANGIAAYLNDGSQGNFDQRAGDHHDAIAYFGLSASDGWDLSNSNRGLLVMNHENISETYLHPSGPAAAPRPAAEADKEIAAHGVSMIEIEKDGAGAFQIVQDSALNRRITPLTPMEIRGPVRNSKFVVTQYDPDGLTTRGTINNCAHGVTPWGTYLTCEENWNGYFKRGADAASRTASDNLSLTRYGIAEGQAGSNEWATVPTAVAGDGYQRWDCTVTGISSDGSDDNRNEPNAFGWVVEIDPFDPTSTPRKRTALGRFAHEGCWVGPLTPGAPVVFYMGDDARYEYIYKFVSASVYDPDDRGLAAGDKYLDDGTLYVAKFNEDGSGEWLELAHGRNGLDADNLTYPFTSQAAVLVNARLAGDVVGATKMDRPEWGAVNTVNGEVYFTLTNNSHRAQGSVNNSYAETAAGADIGVDAANPRSYDSATGSISTSLNGNVNGHIIRWREDGDDPISTGLTWDIFLFGSRASYPAEVNVSGLIAENEFSSPDGLWFDPRGILWIQMDDGAFDDITNDALLAALPGQVGDGGPATIGTQATFVGRPATRSNLRRFLVGPKQCEITGICMTPDNKTMFINIQHPGEAGTFGAPGSNWPNSSRDATVLGTAGERPRSATIVITKNDGGGIGL